MFAIIHDLSSLNEEQRKQYCRDFSVYLGLNPDENRIDTIWIDNYEIRNLVAYVRRGTTDLLRDIHGIDILSLEKEDGPGYVSYKATGINRRGRKEMAVGAYATTGLTGDRLAAAVATAQTRACRRLTLQFIGGGLLDESEVNNAVVSQIPTLLTLPAVQPEVKPNQEAGKPVEVKYDRDVVKKLVEKLNDAPEVPVPVSVEAANAILAQTTPLEPQKPKKPRGRPRKNKNTVDMGDPLPETGVEPTHHEPVIDVKSSSTDISAVSSNADTKLTYVPTCLDCDAFMAADERLDMYLCAKHGRVSTTMKPSMIKTAENIALLKASLPKITPTPETPVVESPKTISPLTEAEQKHVKARLAPFWVDILPKGNMTADDGVSIWGKLIKFANSYFSDSSDYKRWTFDKWEVFFEFLDEFNAENGAAALVEHINKTIGII